MGHARRKPTTTLYNLPELHQLHGLRVMDMNLDHCLHPFHKGWMRRRNGQLWAPGFVRRHVNTL